jgi:chromosome segregation ATPase
VVTVATGGAHPQVATVAAHVLQVQEAGERECAATARAADAVAELARTQQKLLAAEDAVQRAHRAAEALEQDLGSERAHAKAVAERLERAHKRIQALESQARWFSIPTVC